MNRIAGSSNTIGKQLYTQVAHYRHKVFIEMLGWELETRNGEELDQFDRPDTLYVVSQDDDGNVNGCARFFNAARETVSDRFLTTYKAGEPRPDLASLTGGTE